MPLRSDAFRLGLPPSLPVAPAPGAQGRLTRVLSGILGRAVRVVVCGDYDALTDALRRGDVEAAWAPPLVAARAEALGARVLARSVRRGSVRSRAALLVRADSSLQLETLAGTTAAWVDRASLGGHLLAVGWLRERGLDPATLFGQQVFLGSYRLALDALLAGEAEVVSIFAPPEGYDVSQSVMEVVPGRESEVRVLACTSSVLHDAWVVAGHVPLPEALRLERGLVSARELPEGTALLRDVVRAERLERAPELGHREIFGRALADVSFPLQGILAG
jgi:ABC-type phosphate/phosphonate transport system substrate-binding protein